MRVGQMKILTSKTLKMKKKIRYFADTPFCQIRAKYQTDPLSNSVWLSLDEIDFTSLDFKLYVKTNKTVTRLTNLH